MKTDMWLAVCHSSRLLNRAHLITTINIPHNMGHVPVQGLFKLNLPITSYALKFENFCIQNSLQRDRAKLQKRRKSGSSDSSCPIRPGKRA